MTMTMMTAFESMRPMGNSDGCVVWAASVYSLSDALVN